MCSIFVQVLGWNVDAVNTVNFANHSGYRRRAGDGERATGDQLETIFGGMDKNELLEPDRLLTGEQNLSSEFQPDKPGPPYIFTNYYRLHTQCRLWRSNLSARAKATG